MSELHEMERRHEEQRLKWVEYYTAQKDRLEKALSIALTKWVTENPHDFADSMFFALLGHIDDLGDSVPANLFDMGFSPEIVRLVREHAAFMDAADGMGKNDEACLRALRECGWTDEQLGELQFHLLDMDSDGETTSSVN